MKNLRLMILIVGLNFASVSANPAIDDDHPQASYTVISAAKYNEVVQQSERDIKQLIQILQPYQQQPDYVNQLILITLNYFAGRPYSEQGAQGEGDWCPGSFSQRGCVHIQQDPIYRTDSFVCSTLIQTILALLHANNMDDYHKSILTINYGAAHEPPSNIHYYNRNNFMGSDFNPINQANGLLKDVTASGVFAQYAQRTQLTINYQSWFNNFTLSNMVAQKVRVLNDKDGATMALRLLGYYPMPLHRFYPEKIVVPYLPWQALVKKIVSADGSISYVPNEELINQLPIPSVIEIIRDTRKWHVMMGNRKEIIQDAIGSEDNISHLAFIYRQHFKQGAFIYPKITCSYQNEIKSCTVTPVFCNQSGGCSITMTGQARDAYADGFYLYQDARGKYQCTAQMPPKGTAYTMCNRVVTMPFGDYLVSYQFDHYLIMDNTSILGINVQQIQNVNPGLKFH